MWPAYSFATWEGSINLPEVGVAECGGLQGGVREAVGGGSIGPPARDGVHSQEGDRQLLREAGAGHPPLEVFKRRW